MKKKQFKLIIFLLALTFIIIYFKNQIKIKLNSYIIRNSYNKIIEANEINPSVFKVINNKLIEDIIKKHEIDTNNLEINNNNNNNKIIEKTKTVHISKNIDNKTNETKTNTALIGKIDINNAKLKQLESIPGIGPVLAKRIIDYRNRYGKFKSYSDLLKIKGIGNKTLEKIKPYIKIQ